MLTEYTSYNAVRAVLGVSSDEIDDGVLELPMYEVLLSEDVLELQTNMLADYTTAKLLVTPESKRFVRLFQTYASYQVAYTLLGSVPLFAPKDINDSKTAISRVADPFKNLEASIGNTLGYIRGRLLSAYLAYSPTTSVQVAVPRRLLSSVGGYDPVVNA